MNEKKLGVLFISNALISISGFALVGYAVKRTGSLLPLLMAPFLVPKTSIKTNNEKTEEEISDET